MDMPRLDEIGEYSMLDELTGRVNSSEDVVVPVGDDDCSVIRIGGIYLIQSADTISTKPLTDTYGHRPARGIANYLLQANLSDILSTGARPHSIHTLWGFPSDYEYDDYLEFVDSFIELTEDYGIDWLGGDTKETDQVRLSALIQGTVKDEQQLRPRTGAEVGDKVIVTRELGTINAAAFLIDKVDRLPEAVKNRLYEKTLYPEAPVGESLIATEKKLGNGGIDISDGLGTDLEKLAAKSEVGLRIYEEKIPVQDDIERLAAKYTPYHSAAFAMTLGGDWQIVMTMPEEAWQAVKKEMNSIGQATAIGEVTEKGAGYDYIKESGRVTSMPTTGKELFTRAPDYSSRVQKLLEEYSNA